MSSISAFDLDHTLFSVNSSYCFGRYLYTKKKISIGSFAFIIGCNVCYHAGWLSIIKLHESAFRHLFHSRSLLLVRQWAADFVEENFDALLYFPAIEKLMSAQRAGHLTAIFSSSPDFLVEPIAKRLNVSFWDSTHYAVDKDHLFCDIAKLMLGEDKARLLEALAIKHGVPKQEIYAYSDSHLDLPFLKAAGTAYGVNPSRKLRSLCRRNSWSII